MKTYRLRIKLAGNYITPFDADTIFGGICWTIRFTEGEDSLKAFLSKYFEGIPPVILSNAFPGDLLPKPLVPAKTPSFSSRDQMIASAKEAKRVKKIEYLKLEEFLAVAQGETITLTTKGKPVNEMVTLHNQINRNFNSTAEGGQLYEAVEFYLSPGYETLSIYLKVTDDYADKVPVIFEILGQSGLGKRKSAGKGAFKLIDYDVYDGFNQAGESNAFIALSNFVPSKEDPVDGYYKSTVKYGKLGELYALSEYPFKRPLFMIKAGSVFRDKPVRQYYGQLVKSVAPAYPEVVHYGYAFAVPALVE